MRYDLAVIGDGPAAREGALAAAGRYQRVASIGSLAPTSGGVCPPTGNISATDLRNELLHLAGCSRPGVYGDHFRRSPDVSMQDVRRTVAEFTERRRSLDLENFEQHAVDAFAGEARFVGPHGIEIQTNAGTKAIAADKILLACGTRPARPAHVPFDGEAVFNTSDVLGIERTPQSLVVIGGGAIGIDYGIAFAALGADVTFVDRRERLIDLCDQAFLQETLPYARGLGMIFRLGKEVVGIDKSWDGRRAVQLENGKRIAGDAVLYAAGRVGNTIHLNLTAAGLETDERGRLWCNDDQQTWVRHIYGAGDVVGYPAPTGDSIEQSQRAVRHAFDEIVEDPTVTARSTVRLHSTDAIRRPAIASRMSSAGGAANSQRFPVCG